MKNRILISTRIMSGFIFCGNPTISTKNDQFFRRDASRRDAMRPCRGVRAAEFSPDSTKNEATQLGVLLIDFNARFGGFGAHFGRIHRLEHRGQGAVIPARLSAQIVFDRVFAPTHAAREKGDAVVAHIGV